MAEIADGVPGTVQAVGFGAFMADRDSRLDTDDVDTAINQLVMDTRRQQYADLLERTLGLANGRTALETVLASFLVRMEEVKRRCAVSREDILSLTVESVTQGGTVHAPEFARDGADWEHPRFVDPLFGMYCERMIDVVSE